MAQESNYRLISIGVAVETKERGTDWLKVSPMETLPKQQPGTSINEQKDELKGTRPSSNFTDEHTELQTRNWYPAQWRSIGNGNRASAPDVYQGELVVIYHFQDTDKYYWDDLGREPSLRGKEDVIYIFSNQLGGGQGEEMSLESSYSLRVNTIDKYIHLRTVDNDGEAAAYDVIINTAEGSLLVQDNHENSIKLESPAGKLTALVREEILRKTKIIRDESDEHFITTKTLTVVATDKIIAETQSTELISPEILLDGEVQTTGALLVGSSISTGTYGGQAGGGTINGPLHSTEKISTDKDLSAEGDITSSSNITATGTVSGSNI